MHSQKPFHHKILHIKNFYKDGSSEERLWGLDVNWAGLESYSVIGFGINSV